MTTYVRVRRWLGARSATQGESFIGSTADPDRTPPAVQNDLAGVPRWALLNPLLASLLLLVGLPLARAATPQQAGGQQPAGGGECRTVQSHVLNRAVAYCVLLPPSYASEPTRRYPVLYFLHGLGDNEQMFLRSGGLDLLEDLRANHEIGEFLVVTPAGDSSFFINSHDNRVRYEDFFLQEFMPSIERRYRVRPGRTSRGIAGISMGGYGALRLAFVHPTLFGSVSAHSAALMEKLPGNLDTRRTRHGSSPGFWAMYSVHRPIPRFGNETTPLHWRAPPICAA